MKNKQGHFRINNNIKNYLNLWLLRGVFLLTPRNYKD
ncbi:MAG: hypothetical protein MRERV_32c043 [Mycoplasmataceae bacterium RV_VA103A]|nr:MAG: hypothetical protein MRERV_32c043 [Mycoplasmataceae bacterium RV_VA103A]